MNYHLCLWGFNGFALVTVPELSKFVCTCQSVFTFFQRYSTGYIYFVFVFVFCFISNRAPSIPYATEEDLTGIPWPEFTNKLLYQ